MRNFLLLLLTAFLLPNLTHSSLNADTKTENKAITLKMTERKFKMVDFKDSRIEPAGNSAIKFSGSPQTARSAVSITYKNSDWKGFDYLTLRFKLSETIKTASLKTALRNSRRYHKLDNASLLPLSPALEAGKWQEITFDLTKVPREKNNEVRVYLNFNRAMTGKKLSGEIQISLERAAGRIKSLPFKQARQRIFPAPYLAARAHVKYALHINWFSDPDYFAERILMLDRGLEKGANDNDPYGIGGKANFARTVELIQMSAVDGIAMLNIDISRSYLNRTLNGIKYADSLGLKAAIVPEISIFSKGTGDEYLDKQIQNRGTKFLGAEELADKLIPAAVASPSTFKYQGKTLISSYQACVQPPEFWEQYLKECRDKTGDKILFLVELRTIFFNALRRYHKNGGLSTRELNEIRTYLNSYLMVCDGIHFAGQNHLVIPGTRKFHHRFYNDIMIPLFNDVMNQAQNKGKLLGLGVSKGYVNHLADSVQSEDGTRNLRSVIESVMKVNPDYIVLVEWNEIKERTNLEPTIADGRSSMRILRYYFNQLKGKANTPLPGDDPAVPNMILSYRPQLAPGEAMEFEILNVPDKAEAANTVYRVKLELLNLQDKVVKSFPVKTMSAETIMENRCLTYADSQLAKEYILLPRLTVSSESGRKIFASGFPYINISANELRDAKYYKIPLRDLPRPENCEFTATLQADGALTSIAIKSPEKIAYVEILRNRRPVFSAARAPEYKLTPNESLIKISWNAWKEAAKDFPSMAIKLTGGKIRTANYSNRGWGRDFSFKLKNGREVDVKPLNLTHGARRGLYLIVDNSTTNLEIRSGKFKAAIPFAALRGNGFHRLSPGNGFNLMVENFKRIPDLPPLLDVYSCSLSRKIPDVNPRDILSLRYITVTGRIYRSAPVIFADCTQTVNVDAWSDRNKRPGKVSVAAPAAMPLEYKFEPSSGAMLKAPGFDSRFNAELGGSTNYGDSFFLRNNFPSKSTVLKPEWRQQKDGSATLIFDGKGNNLVIPLYAAPARAFTLEFTLKGTARTSQLLLRSYSKTAGALMVVLDEEKLKFRFSTSDGKIINFTTPPLIKTNVWNEVSIAFDLKQFKIKVNDGKTYSYPCTGKPIKMTQLVFGGVGNGKYYGYFKGELKSFKIYPYSTL